MNKINKRIFIDDNLDCDRLALQARIEQCKDRLPFLDESDDWVCLEGKPNKKFLHLEDIKKPSMLHSLLDNQGNAMSQIDEVLRILHDFYKDLYLGEECGKSESEITAFLNGIPSIPKIQMAECLVGLITAWEVESAIKRLRTRKAPGSDGLSADFYKFFTDEITDNLICVFNTIFDAKKLSPSQKLVIIILIFKKGDPQQVTNYRPISLTYCDYKILAYILVGRLEAFLPFIIHSNQTVYMKNHFIGTNIRSVQDVISESMVSGVVVLFLDFCKAFDMVNHAFLLLLLAHMGFPPEFVLWISIFYNKSVSVVCHRNWLTKSFPLKRGVCQGCPLSCYLFNIVGQVLIFSLHDCGFFEWWHFANDPCSLYANNTAIFLSDLSQLAAVLAHIEWVGTFTGL